MNEKIKNNIFLWITPVIWGVAFVMQSMGSEFLGAFTFNAIRFALGVVSLLPVILIFEKKTGVRDKLKTTYVGGAVCGVLLFAASSLQQLAISDGSGAGKAGFLTALYTVMVPVIGMALGKKNSVFTWIGVALATVGMYLLSFKGDSPFGEADIMLIGCALLFSFQIILIDRLGLRIAPLRFSAVQLGTSALLSAVLAIATESCSLADLKSASLAVLYGGIMSCGVGYTTQILGQRGMNETYSAIVFSTESVFAAVSGAIILSETMNAKGYIGCALIFAGIVFSQIRGKNDKKIS